MRTAVHLTLCLAAGVAAGLVVAAVGVCAWMCSGGAERTDRNLIGA